MTTEAEPNLAIDSSDRFDRTRLRWPQLIVILAALLGAYAPFFFYFLVESEALSYCLLTVAAMFAVPLAVLSLQALFSRRWKLVSVFALVWVLLSLPFTGPLEPQESLRVLGFYVHTELADYGSRFQLTEFIENGVKQTAGRCDGFICRQAIRRS